MSTRIETPTGLPVFVLVAFLVSGVLGVARVVATPAGFGVPPPLIRSPLLFLAVRSFHPMRSLLWSSNACTSSLFVDFETAVCFRTYHLVVSVSVRDALRPQPPTLQGVNTGRGNEG